MRLVFEAFIAAHVVP